MVDTWLEHAAGFCLCCFQVVVAGLFVVAVVRLAAGRRAPASVGRIGRFCFEYLGNVDPTEPADRRRNLQGRELVEWVKRQTAKRGLALTQEQRLLQTMRDVIREGMED